MLRKLPRIETVAVVGALILLSSNGAAQVTIDSPHAAIRAFVRAMYANDAAAFRALSVPDSRIHLLTDGGSVNESALRELATDPSGLQIIPKRPFEYRGLPAKPGTDGKYSVGTTAVYVVAHHRSPIVMVVQRRADGWKIDPRWWISSVEMASSAGPAERGTPDFAARSLIGALLAMDRAGALEFVVPGSSADLLFLGAPSQREPSGHLDALAMEMPIVELAPGEFRALLTGGIVEGTSSPDRKVLLGLFGPVEIPFVVRRVGGKWLVEPQPYFALINR